MDADGLKRRDTRVGLPLRILSLDGGGVRGYSMFLIIQELMHRAFVQIEGRAPRRAEIPKPCEHFDLIVGTGTGGLIALMLGRLRLDLETCKELYVRLTRIVFETDKTIAGIPYRSTLFKATKLEEAIKECVREHTIDDHEGNDGTGVDLASPLTAASRSSAARERRHSSNASVLSFSARSPTAQMSRPFFGVRGGNPEALLYDERDDRTKTAVTAIYKGTAKGGDPALLRSYDSRKEAAPEVDCKIWQAGRATCAIGLAFKPMPIGQSVFHDDGAGTFNPSITALDEAVVNEWPGREVGVFVSLGTGKRPKGSDANSAMWYEGFLGEFAEARRRLIAKIEGCERIHEQMVKEHLSTRNVNIENYYRLNVEIGVGEFGMNEWNRLAEISTNTRRYMARDDEQRMVEGVSAKLAKIHFAKQRMEGFSMGIPELVKTGTTEISSPLAVELPGDIPSFPSHHSSPSRQSYESGHDRLSVPSANTPSPRNSGERVRASPKSSSHALPPRIPASAGSPPTPPSARPPPPPSGAIGGADVSRQHDDSDKLLVTAPTPAQYRNASGADKIAIMSPNDQARQQRTTQGSRTGTPQQQTQQQQVGRDPPPLPPKTPLPEAQPGGTRRAGHVLPYPDDDEPPPAVNMAKKPEYKSR